MLPDFDKNQNYPVQMKYVEENTEAKTWEGGNGCWFVHRRWCCSSSKYRRKRWHKNSLMNMLRCKRFIKRMWYGIQVTCTFPCKKTLITFSTDNSRWWIYECQIRSITTIHEKKQPKSGAHPPHLICLQSSSVLLKIPSLLLNSKTIIFPCTS